MMLFLVGFDQGHQEFSVLLFFTRWIILACQLAVRGLPGRAFIRLSRT